MSVIHINEENFYSEVKDSDVPVLIDFWAPWCGPCQMMGPVFQEVSEEFQGKIKFAKINTDDLPEISENYHITGIPCLIFTKNGKEFDRIVGFREKNELIEEVNEILNKL